MLSNDELMAFAKQTALIVREATAPLLARIAELEARPVPVPPPDPVKGDKGDKGDAAVVTDEQLAGVVKDFLTRNPPPKGEKGDTVKGDKGDRGDDAVVAYEDIMRAVEDAHERIVSKHVLDLERRGNDAIQRVIDRLPVPKDGDDGVDGLSMENLTMEYDPTLHEVVLRAGIGAKVVELRYPAGGIRAGGYWREGVTAKSGETWTQDGSMWVALRDTTEEPTYGAKDWYMCVRKGRDGEAAPRKRTSAPGPVKL